MADQTPPRLDGEPEQSSPAEKSVAATSRRRLAFRPQSIKLKHIASKPLKTVASGEPQPGEQRLNEKSDSTTKQLMSPSATTCNALEPEQKSRRRLVTSWSFQETLLFYEALKQHGKDFDSIAKYMNKKKINKDKEQIRNYYFNAFKIWKSKAKIEESDWLKVPRELFVVLNGCEWRKRTCGANFDPVKFKALILDGSTMVRVKKKKSMISIKTPVSVACQSALWKLLSDDKRNSEIPTHLSLKLIPFCYKDRSYVVSCEQNPLLQIQINVNDKITSIFHLLEQKWISQIDRMGNELGVERKKLGVRLRVNEGVRIHKIHVDIHDDSFPMSMKKLKRDYERDNNGSAHNNEDVESSAEDGSNDKTALPAVKRPKECSGMIKLNCKEVFDIDETKIREGLVKENVGNASLLQLFYLCGMKSEVTMSYEICDLETTVEPWSLFVSLVNRDYGELMSKKTLEEAKSMSYGMPGNPILIDEPCTSTLALNANEGAESCVDRRRKVEKTSAGKGVENHSSIVEEENLQFLQQLKALNHPTKKPKRGVKLLPNNQVNKRFCSVNSTPHIPQTMQQQQFPIQGQNYTSTGYIDVGNNNNNQPITYLIASTADLQAYSSVCLQQTVAGTYPAVLQAIEAPQSVVTLMSSQVPEVSQPPTDFSHFPGTLPSTSNAQSMEVSFSVPSIIIQSASSTLSASPSKTVDQRANKQPQQKEARRQQSTVECELVGEFSMQRFFPQLTYNQIHYPHSPSSLDSSSSFINHSVILDSSPSKTLPEDVRHAYEQMLKENSVDYCRNFEQLTRNLDLDSLHKPNAPTTSGNESNTATNSEAPKRS